MNIHSKLFYTQWKSQSKIGDYRREMNFENYKKYKEFLYCVVWKFGTNFLTALFIVFNQSPRIASIVS